MEKPPIDLFPDDGPKIGKLPYIDPHAVFPRRAAPKLTYEHAALLLALFGIALTLAVTVALW